MAKLVLNGIEIIVLKLYSLATAYSPRVVHHARRRIDCGCDSILIITDDLSPVFTRSNSTVDIVDIVTTYIIFLYGPNYGNIKS